ncbi:MAG: isoprenyl transferase [Armatimonadota bacterium]|nr:isoprenyl transferase [Armatimonadota bacterium]
MTSREPRTAPPSDRVSIPTHIAIIMDGNGRWAAARGLPRAAGHRAGRDAVRRTIEACRELGVAVLTLYAFSTENWRRPAGEVGALMELLRESILTEADALRENGIRLRVAGDVESMAPEIRRELDRAVAVTRDNQALVLNVALNYGGRAELVRAVRRIAADVAAGRQAVDAIDETTITRHLYTGDLPDPDLLIRTGAEQRLSNFLLWQSAYTEFCFLDVFWPDFTREHLEAAIAEYQRRQRRFGGAPGV